jgi:Leucine-rich repeat (LRR) protein
MVRLDLSANNLVGRIDDVLHLLPQTLRFLDLRENDIRGPIPPSIGRLGAVRYLDFSINRLTADFPKELEQLGELVHLSAHSNGLAGEVPVHALAQLRKLSYLNLNHNSLRGNAEDLPLKALEHLRYVNLRHNLVEGGLPRLNPNTTHSALVHLDLAENRLDVAIPEWWFNSTGSLRYISLANNLVPGEIPPSIGFPSKLYHIDLSTNKLTGTIPRTIGELSEVRYLNLKGNGLGGEIPESIVGLISLHYLVLGDNAISGTLPADLGALRDLHTLDLAHNRLVGRIPDSLDVIRHHVIELNLGYNRLSNYIPAGICEENACNVCRGAGVCDQDASACTCADGATGVFCEEIDQDGFAQLMFNNRVFFDTTMWQVNDTITNTSVGPSVNTTAANATAAAGG